jgi:catechol 2,3-dioxygenase-like lactoylglutathione lyase family enzyme
MRRALVALALAAAGLAPAATAQVEAVASAGFTTSDLDRAVAFFTGALGFVSTRESELAGDGVAQLTGVPGARLRVATLALGTETLELTQFASAPGRAIPADLASDDLAFQHVAIVVADMDRAYARLREHGVQHVSSAPQTLPDSIPAAAGIRAFYFRDFDGHNLELIWYPPGKGEPRWQERPPGRLFLGIDHTAIGVADTAASLAFWRDALGLAVAGESENAGTEQERLNGVFASRVRITGLRAGAGPGVEFLDYLAPPGGRPIPADLRPNDLLYWQTTLVAADAGAVCARARRQAVTLDAARFGFAKACLVRDPDGHFVRVVER